MHFLSHDFRRKIQKHDEGSIFLCVARNEGGETQQSIKLHIQGESGMPSQSATVSIELEMPVINIYPQLMIYSDQWNVTFTCVDIAGLPRPFLSWQRKNGSRPLDQSSRFRMQNGIMTIFMANKADEGNWFSFSTSMVARWTSARVHTTCQCRTLRMHRNQ
jgi:hypothetical protein